MTLSPSLRTLAIVNPASAGGATRRRWGQIARLIERALAGPFEHVFTDGPYHATALTRRALDAGFEMIVAVGGDGTVNEVAWGFVDSPRPMAQQPILGIIPQGTGCDFARTLGVFTVEQACTRLGGRRTRSIDVGHASFSGHDGRVARRVFLNVASFGCSGRVAGSLTQRTKRAGGPLAFKLVTARTLMTYRDQAVVVTFDDDVPQELAITNCAVCNGRYFGGGMMVAPSAEIDDGCFDVTVWTGFRLLDFIRKRRTLYTGSHISEPGTSRFRARTIKATSPEEVLLEVDGESVGRLPAIIEIFPVALRLKM